MTWSPRLDSKPGTSLPGGLPSEFELTVALRAYFGRDQLASQHLNHGHAPTSADRAIVSDYMRAHGVIVLQIYQPESRFWIFQSLEASLFVAMAAALVGLAIWSIRRA